MMESDYGKAIAKAKAEMKLFKEKGNRFGYKQAKRHYERLLRKERMKNGAS